MASLRFLLMPSVSMLLLLQQRSTPKSWCAGSISTSQLVPRMISNLLEQIQFSVLTTGVELFSGTRHPGGRHCPSFIYRELFEQLRPLERWIDPQSSDPAGAGFYLPCVQEYIHDTPTEPRSAGIRISWELRPLLAKDTPKVIVVVLACTIRLATPQPPCHLYVCCEV